MTTEYTICVDDFDVKCKCRMNLKMDRDPIHCLFWYSDELQLENLLCRTRDDCSLHLTWPIKNISSTDNAKHSNGTECEISAVM